MLSRGLRQRCSFGAYGLNRCNVGLVQTICFVCVPAQLKVQIDVD